MSPASLNGIQPTHFSRVSTGPRSPPPMAGSQRVSWTLLGVPPEGLVVVGDLPGKDVAAAAAVGARSIRIRMGEYAHAPDDPAATAAVADLPAAATLRLGSG
jgi:putative hydrolase of the HAD superfamily